MGWKGIEGQCGNGPHTSVLMDINHLEIKELVAREEGTGETEG